MQMWKRRGFFGRLTAGTLAGAGGLSAVEAGKPAANQPDAELVLSPPAIMAPRADGLEVVWAVSRLSSGRVEWECDDGSRGVAAEDAFGFVPQGDEILRVRVSGLKPGARGRLRSLTIPDKGDTVVSEWRDFRTLDPGATETKFVVWNDTHEHDETIRALHAVTPAADFLLWNGDTCNNWITRDMIEPVLLHPGGCNISADRPLLLTMGNHDVRGPWAWRTERVIAMPEGRPFYALRSGPVAAVFLHTGEDKPDDHPSFGGRVAFDSLRREQAAWLEKVTEQPEFREAPHRVVFCHIPLRSRDESLPDYATGGYDYWSRSSRDLWHEALVKWGAQAVVSGHTHKDDWMPPAEGFPYGQLVGGGPAMSQATWIEGRAAADGLTLRVHHVDGRLLHEVTLPRLT